MNRKRIVLLSLVLFFTAVLAWFIYELTPLSNDKERTIRVEEGESLVNVADTLEKKGLIKNKTFFIIFGKVKGFANQIKPGEHLVSGSLTYSEIYEELVTSHVKKGVKVVIPEGFTVEQIAERLDKKGITNKESFLKMAKTGKEISHPIIKKTSGQKEVTYILEGYLFPDTYYFEKGTAPKEVIGKMLTQFQEVKDQLDLPNELNLHDWVTLASIVEREAVVASERPIIAGVFKNRIEDEWKLQSCATVQYVLDKPKERLLFEDLEVKSPYNTYLNKGLPPGPISNPGKASLKAVINAKQHDYYFFVVKGDGSGEHHFSESFKEHQKYTSHEGNW
ncbi:endolytic transglycosylase MltG [Alkalihalobacillus sp. AL-G]|uniref:endolytic transglycosylase MltG n=1 Tax=Alkalihalobacillus sp. AL-G TaxID=2926399 RepID=UPI00272C96D1|nr:endolytic transglycosylase MltG [Alkalihalobacillus sp. AL-G]WLD92409.1 endolytic transglycosylase MltG [Alkalihalobacillus sp. AL-G]